MRGRERASGLVNQSNPIADLIMYPPSTFFVSPPPPPPHRPRLWLLQVVHTADVLDALEATPPRLGGLAADVYENEGPFFFQDFAHRGHEKNATYDQLLARLLACPRVLLSGHQGFLTQEALGQISGTTVNSLDLFFHKGAKAIPEANLVSAEKMKGRLIKKDWWAVAKRRSRLIVHFLTVSKRQAEGRYLRSEIGKPLTREELEAAHAEGLPAFREVQREYYDADES